MAGLLRWASRTLCRPQGPGSVGTEFRRVYSRATANTNSNTVSVLLGDGEGSFGAKTDFGTGE